MDDERLAELGGEVGLRAEELRLALARRVVAEVVEPGLADGDGLRMREQLAERVEVGLLPGLVRMDPERRRDAFLALRDREGRAARVEARADRDDARDARGPRPVERTGRVLERVEVRVRVDHSAPAAASIRASSSATTCSGSSLRKSGRGSGSARPAGSSPGAQRPTQDA